MILRLVPVLLLSVSAFVHAEPYLPLGPMVGHVSATDARIWIKASEKCSVAIRIGQAPDLSDARTVAGPTLEEEADFMATLHLTDLQPATRYTYCVLLNDRPAMARPYPVFATPPTPGPAQRVRFCFISCVGYEPFEPAASWADMVERTPFDMLFMLGDNHYANSTEPAKQRSAYYTQRAVAGYRFITSRIPTYAIWDDHDFGPNNSDSTLAGKDVSLRTFKQFWANPAYGQEDDPGVYHRFSRGDADFFMLDVRYHRSPNNQKDMGSKTMLGPRQLAWLKRELLASKATFKVLASGSEWQSFGTDDSWTSFKRERQEILDFIDDNKITGVILISGDRHFTAAYHVLGRFIEVTTGPVGGKTIENRNTPEMFIKHDQGKMYCIFELDSAGAEPVATLDIYRAAEGLITRRRFTWSEINGQQKIPLLPPPPFVE